MRGVFINRYLSWGLTALLLLTANPAAAQSSQAESLRRKVIGWGVNKPIVVKLKSGSKIDGRVAEIKDMNFVVQLVENSQVVTREINYSDVDKISGKDGGKAGKIAGYTALGVLAGVGVAFLIVLGIWANN